MYKTDFLRILEDRGFLYQCTNDAHLDSFIANNRLVMYAGFDCTAPSLHVGHLVLIMMLYWAQKCGHVPIVLLGSATTLIGDPNGRVEDRPVLTRKVIQDNKVGIQSVFSKFLRFGNGKNDAILVDNVDWLPHISYLDFMCDYGRHISVNYMLTMDTVSSAVRNKHHLNFLQFSYSTLQAFDFVSLFQTQGCRLQLGGSDQYGNIAQGIRLAKRKCNVKLFGITCPLVANADGVKMGKTSGKTVWLNSDLTTPAKYWDFWRSVDDRDVYRYMRLFTTLSLDEINAYSELQGKDRRHAQIALANAA